ncbi:MAG: YHS domain-containing protein [Myxococcota bacterium]
MPVETLEAVKDLVCGMDVEPRTAAARREFQARTYYFCSHVCAGSFDENPRSYVVRLGAPPKK